MLVITISCKWEMLTGAVEKHWTMNAFAVRPKCEVLIKAPGKWRFAAGASATRCRR
jgi:hypothetical protein